MTGRYKAYPEYKDSGVDWFGNIPSHWRVAGFKKHIASIVDYRGKTPIKTDAGVLLVTARNIKNGKLDYSLSQEYIAPDDYDDVMSRGKPEIGHVLFTTEAPLGEVANIDRVDFALAQRVIKFDGLYDDLNNYYFKYLIMSEEFQQSLNLFASGSTVKGIKAERFVYLRNLLPSYEEQQKIANFLDYETAKIDTLIAKQEKLIELLKEKRQTVISHAVTKGLPSVNGEADAPMKDSGVEWLGEVPEHWGVGRVKNLAKSISKGTTPSTIGGDFIDSGIRFLKGENIGKSIFVNPSPAFHISEEVDAQLSRSRLQENDVLVIIAGATTGKASILTKELLPANTNQAVSFIRPKKANYSKLIAFWLSTDFAQRVIWMGAVQAAQPNLSMENLGNLPIVLPTEDEIAPLLFEIDKKLEQFDLLVKKANGAIKLMKERKTALISAAVTGKIDVRDWKPQGV